MTLYAPMWMGRVSMAVTYMSSLNPGSTTTSTNSSGPRALSMYGFGILTTTVGWMCHASRSPNWRGGGMSAGLPCGAPWSTHLTIVSISSSESDGSFLYFWMPTCLSMNHGGISRDATLALIERDHGRASW